MSLRLPSLPRSNRLTRRGTVLAAIVSLHVLAAIGFSAVRRPELPLADVKPIDVVMLQDTVQERPPEPPPARLTDVRVAEIILPEIQFPVADVPAPTAITVPVVAPASPVSNANTVSAVDITGVEYVRAPAPHYPPTAKRARAQGIVLLIVLIDPEGHARDVRVHRTSGFEQLDVAARDAVYAALFKPHRENGVARSARVIVPIQFSLSVRTASAS